MILDQQTNSDTNNFQNIHEVHNGMKYIYKFGNESKKLINGNY